MPTIKTRMQLDTEKEYRSAIKDINMELKTLGTEMKKVSATFQENADSTEALTAKGQVLEKQLASQKDKVNELQEALNHAKENYGENSNEVQRWQQQLNNAETDVLNTEKAIRDNNAALEKATSVTGDLRVETGKATEEGIGLGNMASNLSRKFGVELPSGLTDSMNSMAGLNAGTVALVAGLAAAVVAIVEVEKALIQLTNESAASADKIMTDSVKYSVSAQTLQEWAYASELVDTSVDTMTGSMTKLNRSMYDVQKGNKDAINAFRELGVSVTDRNGELRDVEDVFWEVVDALGEMDNVAQRDAYSMQVFGRSAKDLNPLIDAGSRKMWELAQEARDMGYVLDDDALSALGAVDDAMQRFNKTTDATKNQVAVEFAPSLERLYAVGADSMQKLGEALADSGLVDLFTALLDIATSLSPLFDVLFDVLGAGIGTVIKPLAVALGVVADALSLICNLIAALVESVKWLLGNGDVDKINRYGANIERVFTSEGATARAWGNFIGNNADGTDNWRGGLTWVGERGPEIVNLPRGSQVIPAEAIGGDVFNITIDAGSVREFNDIVRMAQGARQARRRG